MVDFPIIYLWYLKLLVETTNNEMKLKIPYTYLMSTIVEIQEFLFQILEKRQLWVYLFKHFSPLK